MAAERWNDNTRVDGLRVTEDAAGWVIEPRAGGLPVVECPCCGKTLKTARAARLVADALFPDTGASDGSDRSH
jgi:hypothetical protein